MSARALHTLVLAFGVYAALIPAHRVLAYEIVKPTVSGGAVDVAGGSYHVSGTIGEAGLVGETSGGSYQLHLGFWPVPGATATDVSPSPGAEISFINGLAQNWPNPFAFGTTIQYTVAQPSTVRLSIFDVAGRLIVEPISAPHDAGRFAVHWDGRDRDGRRVASGIYFYRLEIGSWTETRKMVGIR